MRVLPCSSADTTGFDPALIDSDYCDNPIINPTETWSAHTQVAHEKQVQDFTVIMLREWAEYNGGSGYNILSDAKCNQYLCFGPGGALCFETLVDFTRKISCSMYPSNEPFALMNNETADYYNGFF